MTKQNFKAECERRRKAGLVLTGQTYMQRDGIKRDGGIWDARAKGWLMPDGMTFARWMLRCNDERVCTFCLGPARDNGECPLGCYQPSDRATTGIRVVATGIPMPGSNGRSSQERMTDPGYVPPLPGDRNAWPPAAYGAGCGDLYTNNTTVAVDALDGPLF